MYGMGRNGVVSMNKFVKILLGTLAGVIIVGTILKQSGDRKRKKKLGKQSGGECKILSGDI